MLSRQVITLTHAFLQLENWLRVSFQNLFMYTKNQKVTYALPMNKDLENASSQLCLNHVQMRTSTNAYNHVQYNRFCQLRMQ